MTIQTANELKEGCGKSFFDKKLRKYVNTTCGDFGCHFCPECKAKAKANLEKLGCGKDFRHGGIDLFCCHLALCPKHQEEKEIYEEILSK